MKRITCILTATFYLLPAVFVAQVALHLTVNSAQSDTIEPAEPVMLRLVISNPAFQYARVHNVAVQQNLELLAEDYAAGKIAQDSMEAERTRLQAAMQTSTSASFDPAAFVETMQVLLDGEALQQKAFMLCESQDGTGQQQEIGDDRLTYWFGISAEATGEWSAGTHTVRVMFDSIFSNDTRLTISPSGDTEPDDERRTRHAHFYLNCGDIEAASAIADELMRTAQTIDVITLNGEVLEAREDPEAALEMYRRALEMFYQQYPDSYEAPEYLLDKIAGLEGRRD